MPQITISAQLIRIGRPIHPGQWLLIHPDERYDVLTHEQAMALQGRRVKPTPPAKIPDETPVKIAKLHYPKQATIVPINGKTIRVEPQKMALLQYMAAHGQITVAEATILMGTRQPTTILSALKLLGLVASTPTGASRHPHVYNITNEGRAIANGAVPAA